MRVGSVERETRLAEAEFAQPCAERIVVIDAADRADPHPVQGLTFDFVAADKRAGDAGLREPLAQAVGVGLAGKRAGLRGP